MIRVERPELFWGLRITTQNRSTEDGRLWDQTMKLISGDAKLKMKPIVRLFALPSLPTNGATDVKPVISEQSKSSTHKSTENTAKSSNKSNKVKTSGKLFSAYF